MCTRDSFQSSVSGSEKSTVLPCSSFLSLDLGDFSLFLCSAASEVLRLRNPKSSYCTLGHERPQVTKPCPSLPIRWETGGNENT